MKSILPDGPTVRPKVRVARARTRDPRKRPTAGEARACRQHCRQAPELIANATTKLGTIPILKGFARKPFRKTVFTTGRSLCGGIARFSTLSLRLSSTRH
jgi:hypothetical protein